MASVHGDGDYIGGTPPATTPRTGVLNLGLDVPSPVSYRLFDESKPASGATLPVTMAGSGGRQPIQEGSFANTGAAQGRSEEQYFPGERQSGGWNDTDEFGRRIPCAGDPRVVQGDPFAGSLHDSTLSCHGPAIPGSRGSGDAPPSKSVDAVRRDGQPFATTPARFQRHLGGAPNQAMLSSRESPMPHPADTAYTKRSLSCIPDMRTPSRASLSSARTLTPPASSGAGVWHRELPFADANMVTSAIHARSPLFHSANGLQRPVRSLAGEILSGFGASEEARIPVEARSPNSRIGTLGAQVRFPRRCRRRGRNMGLPRRHGRRCPQAGRPPLTGLRGPPTSGSRQEHGSTSTMTAVTKASRRRGVTRTGASR